MAGSWRAGAPAPHELPELRSGGRFDSAQGREPGAAVPTFPPAASSAATYETISIQAQAEVRTPSNLIVNVELDQIDKNPYQTRYDFDKELLEELAESIRVNGIVQPVVVRPGEDGRYILILGERRCRASKMAGKTTVPAIVKRVSDQQAAEMTIVENLQRQDLNCIEQAEAFRVLSQEFNLTQQQIGDRVGMSRESVSNYMRLLRLTQPVMEHVLAGRIAFSEARELLKLEDPLKIELAAERVVKDEMKFEQVETMVARMTGWLDPVPGLPGQERKKPGARWMDPNVRAAQTELERLLQVRVRIKDRKGKGKIVIEYSTVDDYERVVEALKRKG
jgi:ParB family chromosome partitioning protein